MNRLYSHTSPNNTTAPEQSAIVIVSFSDTNNRGDCQDVIGGF
jgi:hypothetical protein